MGFFRGIGAFLGLIDSNETASKLAGDISSGIDKIFYTDEEKSDASKAAFDQWLKMVSLMQDSETYRSVTRRILAVLIVFNLLIMIWLCIAAEMLHAVSWVYFDTALFDMISEGGLSFTNVTWAILKIANSFQLGWVFCTIIVFYFGPHLIQFFSKGK